MVVLACNPSACEAAARALPQVQGHCGLYNKFQTSQGYASPFLKNSAKKINSIHFTSSLLSSTRISDSSWVSALPPPCFSGPNSSSSVCTLHMPSCRLVVTSFRGDFFSIWWRETHWSWALYFGIACEQKSIKNHVPTRRENTPVWTGWLTMACPTFNLRPKTTQIPSVHTTSKKTFISCFISRKWVLIPPKYSYIICLKKDLFSKFRGINKSLENEFRFSKSWEI